MVSGIILQRVAAACLVLSLFAKTADCKIYTFDMGQENSPVCDGFVQVTKTTAYTADRGYGWESTAALTDVARRPYRGGERLRPDDLCGDFVTNINAPFLLDLPSGRYVVRITLGDTGKFSIYPCASYSIRANGEVKYKEVITAENFFTGKYLYRSMDKEWRKGNDLWKEWVDPYFQPVVFETNVTNGRLILDFSPSCCLDALIVYPAEEKAATQALIARTRAKRKAQFTSMYILKTPPRETYKPTARQHAKGYLLFSRNYVNSVLPSSAPKEEEINKPLRVFAARGEEEPATFRVYPMKDIKGVTINCTALTDGQGHSLPADAVRIKHVTYRAIPYYALTDTNTYSIKPFMLKEKPSADFERGVTRQVWLSLRVVEDAAPGVYSGRITFRPANAAPTELPIKLRVLPFKLQPMPNDVSFGFYYYLPDQYLRYFPDEGRFWAQLGRELTLMKRYNLTSALAGIWLPKATLRDGHVALDMDGSYIKKFMELYLKSGMRAPLGWYHFTNNLLSTSRRLAEVPQTADSYGQEQFDNPRLIPIMKEMVNTIEQYREKQGWPKILYYLQDEYGAHHRQKGVDWAKRITSIYHEVPGIDVCGGVCNDLETQMTPLFDLPLLNPVVLKKDYTDKVAQLNKPIGFYNLGTHRINGFYFWKIQAKMHMQWVFHTRGGADPYNFFDCITAPELTVVYPAPGGAAPTMEMEILREALDDYRYCSHLNSLIERAKASGKYNAAAQARKTLDGALSYIRPDYLWYTKEGRFPSADAYNKLRWRIAREIIKLTETLER